MLIEEAENNVDYIVKSLKSLTKTELTSGRQIIAFIDVNSHINLLSILQYETRALVFIEGEYNVYGYTWMLTNHMEIHHIHEVEVFISLIVKTFSKKSISEYLLRNNASLTIDAIINDIRFFHAENKLTSRLAIFIYKIGTFNFNASAKKIGLECAKIYGKSRNIYSSQYGISNVKGYIVSSYAHPIRIEIAKKLLLHPANLLDPNIAEITGLDLKLVMYLRGNIHGNMQ